SNQAQRGEVANAGESMDLGHGRNDLGFRNQGRDSQERSEKETAAEQSSWQRLWSWWARRTRRLVEPARHGPVPSPPSHRCPTVLQGTECGVLIGFTSVTIVEWPRPAETRPRAFFIDLNSRRLASKPALTTGAADLQLRVSEPKWRNWQTRQVQDLVPV